MLQNAILLALACGVIALLYGAWTAISSTIAIVRYRRLQVTR
jgi:hypothetical protein